MISNNLLRSTVINQIAFDQQDLHSSPELERAMDRLISGAGFQTENLGYHYFYLTEMLLCKELIYYNSEENVFLF